MNDTVSEDVKLDEAGLEAAAIALSGAPFPMDASRRRAERAVRAYLAATKPASPLPGDVTVDCEHEAHDHPSHDWRTACLKCGVFRGSDLLASPPMPGRLPYARIIEIVDDCSERMKASGESHRMFAKWVSEGINAALSAASAVRSEGVVAWRVGNAADGFDYYGPRQRATAEAMAKSSGQPCTPLYTSPVQTREELQRASDAAYVHYINLMRSKPCLGFEAKLASGTFGAAELKAHCEAAEYLGRHRALAALLSQPEPKGDKT